MVELVELLCQFVAVVGNAAWAVVLSGLFYCSSVCVELLYEVDFLLRQQVVAQLLGDKAAASCRLASLAHDRAYAGVGVLNKRTCVAVEVDRLLGVEEHVLACVNLEYEVFQCAETYHTGYLVAFLFSHVVKLA